MKRRDSKQQMANASRRAIVKKLFRADVVLLIAIVLGWYFGKNLRKMFSMLSLIPFLLLWFMMLLFPAEVTLEEKDSKATRGKTKVLWLLLSSTLYSGLRLRDQVWLEPLELVWKAVPLFAVLLAAYLFRVIEWRRTFWKLALTVVTFAVFSSAAVGLVNVGLDFNQPVQIVSQVSDKRISGSSSKGATTYYLEAPFEEDYLFFVVSRELYSQYEIGDEVTINVGSGALGIAYARVAQ